MDFRPASELDAFQFLRLLVMGPVREGKSCSVILTAPGPVAVLNGDNKNSLKSVIKRAPAACHTRSGERLFLPDSLRSHSRFT